MEKKTLTQYPIFFKRNRVKRVYQGGFLFSDFLGDEKKDSYYPEEWIASTVTANNKDASPLDGLSIIEDTTLTFKELLARYPDELLGPYTSFDVLVKYLDSAIRLPVQVHPDKIFSRKHFKSSYGKTEMWLILATREDACIYLGFKSQISKEQFSSLVEDSLTDKEVLTPLLNRIPVSPGEVYLIPARTIHAIGAGCLILEVQEPTDFTIQPEYWCGEYSLSKKEMYLGLSKENALDCFDFSLTGKTSITRSKKIPRLLHDADGIKEELLISYEDTPCFQVKRFLITSVSMPLFSAPALYIITQGSGTLSGKNYQRILNKGDYFFLPCAAGSSFHILASDSLELVECLPPAPKKIKVMQSGFNYSQDGPGNRLVYHLQGCNMHCPWCSNPEGMSLSGTMMITPDKLLDSVCEYGAVRQKTLKREYCACCTDRPCLTLRKNSGIRLSCHEETIRQMVKTAADSRSLFFDGGGVTISGGEATLQFEPLKELLSSLRLADIHTTLETNGTHPQLEGLFPYIDCLIIDLKHPSEALHKKLTGVSNTVIKHNIKKAMKMHPCLLIRTPLIHGFNDDARTMKSFVEFYKTCDYQNASFELLSYHEYGKEKWESCGIPYTMTDAFITKECLIEYENFYRQNNFKVIRT